MTDKLERVDWDYYDVRENGDIVNKKSGRQIKKSFFTSGYVQIGLRPKGFKTGDGYITLRLHRVIAFHHCPNPDNKPEVNHINGDKTDNRACNLEWCTSAENSRHAVEIGIKKGPQGEKARHAKLCEEDVLDMRWLYSLGLTMGHLASEFDVSQSSAQRAIRGTCWGHL